MAIWPQNRTARNNRLARQAGGLYLAYIVLFAWYTFMPHGEIRPEDFAASAQVLQHSVWLFRFAAFTELLAALLFFLAAWSLATLFRDAGRTLALLLVLLNLGGVVLECASVTVRLAALPCIAHPELLRGFNADQVHAVVALLMRASGEGMAATTLFYGAWLFPLGVLVYRSRLIPRLWGVLLIADGVALMISFIQILLFPAYQKWIYPLYPVMLVAEAGTSIWLLIRGVRESAPSPQAE